MQPLPKEIYDIIIAFSIVFGAVQCFFGYRIFKIVLGMMGFLFGGVLASIIGYAVSQEVAVAVISGLVGGFIGAVLMVALYFVGIFLIGALFGGILAGVLFAAAQTSPEPAVLIVAAVFAGIIALVFQKFIIIVSTAFNGAWAVVSGIGHFTTDTDFTDITELVRAEATQLYVVILCSLALGIVGVIVQYRTAPAKEEDRSHEIAPEMPMERSKGKSEKQPGGDRIDNQLTNKEQKANSR